MTSLLVLRLKKFWWTNVSRRIWPDLPFEIAYAEIAEQYGSHPTGQRLAEFDYASRHYYVYVPSDDVSQKD